MNQNPVVEELKTVNEKLKKMNDSIWGANEDTVKKLDEIFSALKQKGIV